MEKGRYEYIHNDEIGDGLLDIETNNKIYDIEQMSVLLNLQDAKIKGLKGLLNASVKIKTDAFNSIQRLKQENKQLKQLQNQKVIEALERIKDYFVEEDYLEDGTPTGDWIITKDSADVAEYIDNQIKELEDENE